MPGLGRVPGLGWLFRARKTEHNKTNLMVFLRPVVLRDSAGYGGFTAERYRLMLGEQDRLKPPAHPILPDYPGPQLPPVDPSRP